MASPSSVKLVSYKQAFIPLINMLYGPVGRSENAVEPLFKTESTSMMLPFASKSATICSESGPTMFCKSIVPLFKPKHGGIVLKFPTVIKGSYTSLDIV